MSGARDPYKYFRIEGRELLDGLSQGVLALEKGASPARDTVAHLLRLAHTLKGAARVVKLTPIAEHAHAIESLLAAHRGGASRPDRDEVASLLRRIDRIAADLAKLDAPAPEATEPAERSGAEEVVETVRVELEEVDTVLESLGEAAAFLRGLGREVAGLDRVRHVAAMLVHALDHGPHEGSPGRARVLAAELNDSLAGLSRTLVAGFERLGAEIDRMNDAVGKLRLLPASSIFPSLERAVRDAAEALPRTVHFRATGGDVRIDAYVLMSLRDALLHVARNAVAHGIETESERAAADKPTAGTVEVVVERRAHRVAFTCRDDGRGIDVAALGRAAAREGRITPSGAADLTPQMAFDRLLGSGLTTSRTVTEVSGRGIGLDVVRDVAARLKGEVRVRSEPGKGASFEILVPVSLSSVPALFVEDGGVTACVPIDSVRATLRVPDAQVLRRSGRQSLEHEGKVIPVVALGRALGRQVQAARSRAAWSAVVVDGGRSLAVVGVDALRGTGPALVRALPDHAEVDAVVLGVAMDVEGNPQLVLDPAGLVVAAERAADALDERPPESPAVLVVDDSLTTRMLERAILESAGYEVDLATSAEEGLAKARTRPYDLFLVDVEMPGMDGFQFVAQTRGDPALRDTPAILVTSRASAEDRRRGEEVGAAAYIVKGEFDQALLLGKIRDLVG